MQLDEKLNENAKYSNDFSLMTKFSGGDTVAQEIKNIFFVSKPVTTGDVIFYKSK